MLWPMFLCDVVNNERADDSKQSYFMLANRPFSSAQFCCFLLIHL